jgi:hypothetical protein
MPKGQPVNRRAMAKVVKHFHLAFKGMETDEIYDVLMENFISVANRYDPGYTEKVKLVVGVIKNELSKRKQFAVADVNRHLEFDCSKHLRVLCRGAFLSQWPAPSPGPTSYAPESIVS